VLRLLTAALLLALLAACSGAKHEHPVVARVIDGDTVVLADGRHVRLLQIDAPELSEDECYAREARHVLAKLVPPGTETELVTDAGLDEVDDYGRLLRYLFAGGENVNVELARRGAVGVYFFHGDRGVYADEILTASEKARTARRGLWGACPATPFEPERKVEAMR
jgi:micrococcal nuclease